MAGTIKERRAEAREDIRDHFAKAAKTAKIFDLRSVAVDVANRFDLEVDECRKMAREEADRAGVGYTDT